MAERTVKFIDVSRVIWDKRVFTFKSEVVKELRQSFREVGQLQPIVVFQPDPDRDVHKLNIGRHRYQAAKENYKEDPNYVHMFLGQPCPPNTIAAIDVADIPAEVLLNMEVSENVYRMELSWQEKCAALAQIHTIEKAKFEEKKIAGEVPPEAEYTISQTAKKLAGATGGNPEAIANRISQSLILAKRLDDPDIARAESAKAAYNNLRHKLTAELRKQQVDYDGETPHTLIEGDAIDMMIRSFTEPAIFPPFTLTLADPPYGIGADSYDNMKQHKYDDSWPNARETYQAIAHLAMNLGHDRSNLMLFCTPERWKDVRDIAEAAGWVSWPRPVIWLKSNEGMRPWGQQGLAYTYECIYWGTKGKKGLISSANDVFQYYKPKSSEREHAAAKPIELYARLFELTCLPGDAVLDPCAGSGTSFKAGIIRNVRVVGVELNAETAQIARKNLFWTPGQGEAARVEPEREFAPSLADL